MTTHDMDALAAHLATAPPTSGPLDHLDFTLLSATGRIDALLACARHLTRAHALLVRALGTLDTARDDGSPIDCTDVEVAVALRWAPTVAQQRLTEAGTLTRRLPETLTAMETGQVWFEQARILADATTTLTDTQARAVQDRVLPLMPRQTPAATRRATHRALHRIDPHTADTRHRQQRQHRRVTLRPEPDAMATLELYTPADTATALMTTLTRLAQQRTPDDPRTLDQRRADTLTHLILTATGTPVSATTEPLAPALVHVTIPADTLLGHNQEPGELSGHGPITATHARTLAFAPHSRWRWLLTTGDGTLIHASPRTYTPTHAVARFVRLRDHTCAFPHCTMPATRCDLDHTTPFDKGGPTTPDNLHPLCRHHHQLKTRGQWTVHKDPTTGTLHWTAPTGHTYTTTPHTHPDVHPTRTTEH